MRSVHVDVGTVAAANLQRFERGFSANPATRGGIEIPFEGWQIQSDASLQFHADDILKVLPINHWPARPDLLDLLRGVDDSFSEQEPGRQFHIMAGRAHRDG